MADLAAQMGRRSRWLFLAVLILAATVPASGQSLPPPTYENSRFIFVDPPWLGASDPDFQSFAATILGTMPGGTYARPGLAAFLAIDMPWVYDAGAPALTSPSRTALAADISRAQASGLAVHFQADAGVSRATHLYDAARLEDRRNCQWYSDNLLEGSPPAVSESVWMTPSRYARKLRRHLETKTRLWAAMLVSLRQQFPDTLQSASGDGEVELNSGRLDDTIPYSQQIIADYSPFAILEFRDWIQHSGLYAQGQLYEGQGSPAGGSRFQGPEGLASFNQLFGTDFGSWNLRYFDWALDDAVDGDPRSIPSTTYETPGWNPMPSSGPDFIPSGFDAPRAYVPSSLFWQLWLDFRREMVNHYVRDFSSWITTTADAAGNFLEPSRWYSHQIPADYLFGKNPADPLPFARLLTSASPMRTALVHPTGSLGLTSFDLYLGLQVPPAYLRTSQYLFPDLAALNLPNWGLMEYSPSWGQDDDPATGAPICDPDVTGISKQVDRAFDAGAHVLVLNNWPLCTQTTISSFGLSLARLQDTPRIGATSWWDPPPPAPQGLQASWFNTTITLAWSDQVFGTPSPTWSTWGYFSRFEVWRGANAAFTVADGQLVATSVVPSLAGIHPDSTRPFYKVLSVGLDGLRGAFSVAVSPAPPPGSGFFTLTPCRLFDTRTTTTPEMLGGPALSPGEVRVLDVGGRCNIPSDSRSLSANVTVVSPSAGGYAILFPGDSAPPLASSLAFSPGRVRANNALLSLSADGKLGVLNVSTGSTDLVIDVSGYFR